MRPLPVIADLLVAVVFAWVGCRHGRTLHRKGVRLASKDAPRRAWLFAALGIFFIFANTALLIIKSYPQWMWFFPAAFEYYAVAIVWLVDVAIMAFAFAADVSMAFHERHRARWPLLVGALLVLPVCGWAFHQSPWARRPELKPPRVSADGIVLQSTSSTCAAATCANIARSFGIEKSEQDMVKLLDTTESGTSPSQIVYGLARLGLTCTKRYVPDLDIAKITPPAVLFTGIEAAPDVHAIAFMGFNGKYVRIWDPMNGEIPETEEDLKHRWQGRALEVRRR